MKKKYEKKFFVKNSPFYKYNLILNIGILKSREYFTPKNSRAPMPKKG
jgi:hypothetical protein